MDHLYYTFFQSPGKYVALSDCIQNKPDSIVINSGDVIQLKSEDAEGCWWVFHPWTSFSLSSMAQLANCKNG